MSRRVISWNKFTYCPFTLSLYNIPNCQYQKYLPLKCSKPCKIDPMAVYMGVLLTQHPTQQFGPTCKWEEKNVGFASILSSLFPFIFSLLFLLFFGEPGKLLPPGGVRSLLLRSSSGHLRRCCPLLRPLPAPLRLPALPAAAPLGVYILCRPLACVVPSAFSFREERRDGNPYFFLTYMWGL